MYLTPSGTMWRALAIRIKYEVADQKYKDGAEALRQKRAARDKERKENMEDFEALIPPQQETKKCQYQSCENQIPINSQFQYCETCRAFAARNAIALRLDPISPMAFDRVGMVENRLLTHMTGEEILRYAKNLEDHYLEVQKTVKLFNLVSENKRTLRSYEEQIGEARDIEEKQSIRVRQAKKREEKKQSREKKGATLFGVSESKFKEIMGEIKDDELGDL